MVSALERAKQTSEWSFHEAPYGPFEAGEKLSIEWVMHRAELAALVAIAEQAKRIADALNSIDTVLVNAEGPDGAIKITLDQDLVEAIGFIE